MAPCVGGSPGTQIPSQHVCNSAQIHLLHVCRNGIERVCVILHNNKVRISPSVVLSQSLPTVSHMFNAFLK